MKLPRTEVTGRPQGQAIRKQKGGLLGCESRCDLGLCFCWPSGTGQRPLSPAGEEETGPRKARLRAGSSARLALEGEAWAEGFRGEDKVSKRERSQLWRMGEGRLIIVHGEGSPQKGSRGGWARGGKWDGMVTYVCVMVYTWRLGRKLRSAPSESRASEWRPASGSEVGFLRD